MLVSIQGLILVAEPYYNEAGYERQKGSRIGAENARMYNEMAVLKMTQHMGKLAQELLQRVGKKREEQEEEVNEDNYVWKVELTRYFKAVGKKLVHRLQNYLLEDDGVDGGNDDVNALVNGAQQTSEEEEAAAAAAAMESASAESDGTTDKQPNKPLQDFPLVPVSKGFRLTLKLSLKALEDAVSQIDSL